MPTESWRQKHRGDIISVLNVAIQGLDFAQGVSTIPPAQAIFGSVSILLTMIRVRLLPSRQ